jgi:adenylate cyclase
MAIETERKFLVRGNGWKKGIVRKINIRQGYLSKTRSSTVRIRITNDKAFITVKGKRHNLSCPEFEYEIPMSDAEQMIALSVTPVIEKTRYVVTEQWLTWDVDVFSGINEGLVMAEIEFGPDNERGVIGIMPKWIGAEVSYDKRYTNTYLAEHAVPHCL